MIMARRTLRESDRALRDGSFGWRYPRHFVPGYDRTVPPGQSHSPIEAAHNLSAALTGRTPTLGLKTRLLARAKLSPFRARLFGSLRSKPYWALEGSSA